MLVTQRGLREGQLSTFARTGSENTDVLLLLTGGAFTLIFLHCSALIDGQRFPGLPRIPAAGKSHRSLVVAFDGQGEALKGTRLNELLGAVDVTTVQALPAVHLRPNVKSPVIPQGAHFLTQLPNGTHKWTPVEQAMKAPTSAPSAVSSAGPSAVGRPTAFSVLLQLLTPAATSSSGLPAYALLCWLDTNTLLLSLRRVSRALHVLITAQLDDAWWQQRLRACFGTAVTRWPVAALLQWRRQRLEEQQEVQQGQRQQQLQQKQHQRAGLSASAVSAVLAQPLWCSAAVWVQCRLNTFSVAILRQPLSQLQEADAEEEGANMENDEAEWEGLTVDDAAENEQSGIEGAGNKRKRETNQTDSKAKSKRTALRRPACRDIPSFLLSLLLASPPFQRCPSHLKPHWELWSRASHQMRSEMEPEELNHPDVCWLAYMHREEGGRYLGIYVGECVVHSSVEDGTVELGVPAGRAEQFRWLYIDDADQLPLVVWERRYEEIELLEQRSQVARVRRYIETLHDMWEANVKRAVTPTDEPMQDEDDLRSEWKEEEEGEQNEEEDNKGEETEGEEDNNESQLTLTSAALPMDMGEGESCEQEERGAVVGPHGRPEVSRVRPRYRVAAHMMTDRIDRLGGELGEG